jgi:glycosyltransferase A (GT-A) superfamily protein (DUF2064 family)
MPSALVIMTRSTSDPRIKERLAPSVPTVDARRDLALAFIDDLSVRARAMPGIRLRLAVTPPVEGLRVDRPTVPADTFLVQRGMSLGERQFHVFEDLAASGFRRVVMIGSSMPDLSQDILARAFAVLGEHPSNVVVGPSDSGACYLIGASVARGAVPDLFTSVRWDSPYALDDLAYVCGRAGKRLERLDVWNAVVAPSDLEQLATRLRFAPETAPHTADALRSLRLL